MKNLIAKLRPYLALCVAVALFALLGGEHSRVSRLTAAQSALALQVSALEKTDKAQDAALRDDAMQIQATRDMQAQQAILIAEARRQISEYLSENIGNDPHSKSHKFGANVDHSTTTIHGGHSLVVEGDSLGGFMSGADKTKLDGIATGAQVVSAANVQAATATLASALPFNGQKGTGVANGTASSDIAAFGQIAATTLSSFAAPTTSVNMSSQKLVSLADGTSAQDGAAFHQIGDAVLSGKSTAIDALLATNQASLTGLAQTIDGVALSSAGMRTVLVGQTTTTQDGCYVVASGAWARCADLPTGADAALRVFNVRSGTANKGTWVFTNAAGAGIVGTNDLVGLNISGSGGSSFPPSGDLPMASHGFTSMRAGTTTGEGVTYEQVADAIKSQAGGALGSNRAVEEFDRVVNTSGTGVIANGSLFGVLPWRAGFTGTGAAVSGVTTNQDTTHVGVLDLATGTTTTGIANVTGSGVGIELLGSGMTAREDWIAQPSALSDGTNTYQTRFGYFDSTTAPTNGLYWEYVQGTSVNWRCVAMAASTPTVASGGSNVAVATTWQHLEWDWDGTNITCKVDGTSLGTIAGASLPSTPTALIAEITKSAGATNTHLYLDLYQRLRTYSPPKAN